MATDARRAWEIACQRCAVRLAAADPHSRLHHRRRAVTRHRHRCEHGGVRCALCRAAAAAARGRPCLARGRVAGTAVRHDVSVLQYCAIIRNRSTDSSRFATSSESGQRRRRGDARPACSFRATTSRCSASTWRSGRRSVKTTTTRPGNGGARGPVAVLSHQIWMQRFGGDPAIAGKSIR